MSDITNQATVDEVSKLLGQLRSTVSTTVAAIDSGKDYAIALANSIGPAKYYDTLDEAEADLANLTEGDLVEISQDEEKDGARTRRKFLTGSLGAAVAMSTVLTGRDLEAASAWPNVPEISGQGGLNALNAQAAALAERTEYIKAAIIATTGKSKSLLEAAPMSEWDAILNGTSAMDLSDALQDFLDIHKNFTIPSGAWFTIKKQLKVRRGKSIFGAGRNCGFKVDVSAGLSAFPGGVGFSIYIDDLPSNGNVDGDYGRYVGDFSVQGGNAAALKLADYTGLRVWCDRSISNADYDASDVDDVVFFSYIGVLRNINVERFEAAFDFREMWRSKCENLIARDCRRTFVFSGKSVDNTFINPICARATPDNSLTGQINSDTWGWDIHKTMYGTRSGFPEAIKVFGGSTTSGVVYGFEIKDNPFKVHFVDHEFDCRKGIGRIYDSVQDFVFRQNNCTVRYDGSKAIEFFSTSVDPLSHSITIDENFFDCQTPTTNTADCIVFPASGQPRNNVSITSNKLRGQWRNDFDLGGSSGNVGGVQHSEVLNNITQQQTAGKMVTMSGNARYTKIAGNRSVLGLQVLDASAAAPTCEIGMNISPTQITGGKWKNKKTFNITPSNQTFELVKVSRLDGNAHFTKIKLSLSLRGNAVYRKEYIVDFSKSAVFGDKSGTTELAGGYAEENSNYGLSFSLSTVTAAGTCTINLSAKTAGAVDAVQGSVNYVALISVDYETENDALNIN